MSDSAVPPSSTGNVRKSAPSSNRREDWKGLPHCFSQALRVVHALGSLKEAAEGTDNLELEERIKEYRREAAYWEENENLIRKWAGAIDQARSVPFHWKPSPDEPWLIWAPAIYALGCFCGEIVDSTLALSSPPGSRAGPFDWQTLRPALRKALMPFDEQFLGTEINYERNQFDRWARTDPRYHHQMAGTTEPPAEAGNGGSDVQPPAGSPLSAKDLATMLGKPVDTVDSFLRRYRDRYPDCFITTESRRRNEPKYLYRVADVIPALKEHFQE